MEEDKKVVEKVDKVEYTKVAPYRHSRHHERKKSWRHVRTHEDRNPYGYARNHMNTFGYTWNQWNNNYMTWNHMNNNHGYAWMPRRNTYGYAEATTVVPMIVSYAYHKGDWKNV